MHHAHRQFTDRIEPIALPDWARDHYTLEFETAIKDRLITAATLGEDEHPHITVTFRFDPSLPFPIHLRIESDGLTGESSERVDTILRAFESSSDKNTVAILPCHSHAELSARTLIGLAHDLDQIDPTSAPIDIEPLKATLPRPTARVLE